MSFARRVLGSLVVGAISLMAVPASAEPSIWARAADPKQTEGESLLHEAEALFAQWVAMTTSREPEKRIAAPHFRDAAKAKLAEAHAESASDPNVRARYAELLEDSGEYDKSIAVLQSLLAMSPNAALRTEAFYRLALSYAHLGKHSEEIRAYDGALEGEPSEYRRSNILANRAEALMGEGLLFEALEGYRRALSFNVSPSTLWGHAVALDRTGDLDGALGSIRLARTYDPMDRSLGPDTWFYAVERDRWWYGALGHWARARASELEAVRAEELARAVESWLRYVTVAPKDDPYLDVARARLAACTKERALASRNARKPSRPSVR